jgi:hypothetical protein
MKAIHCLAPSMPHCILRIEEAVAVSFSLSVASEISDAYAEQCERELPEFYREVYEEIRELEIIEQRAIWLLRERQPEFRNLTPELLKEVAHVPDQLAETLCQERQF